MVDKLIPVEDDITDEQFEAMAGALPKRSKEEIDADL